MDHGNYDNMIFDSRCIVFEYLKFIENIHFLFYKRSRIELGKQKTIFSQISNLHSLSTILD